MMWQAYYRYIRNKIRSMEYQRYLINRKARLRNRDFSIIASNCNGAFMYHDLGLRYLSPTVNLTIEINGFVKMVENLEWYMEQKIVEVKNRSEYPVGELRGIRINFIHYKSFEEAVKEWEERKRRIKWNNLFIVGTARGDLCTYDTIKNFDKLPYKNKVIFTNIKYTEFQSAYYIRGFEEQSQLGVLVDYKNQFLLRRYLDDFDYVNFLNSPLNSRG